MNDTIALDIEPMEALVFGVTESELSSVVAVSGDVLLGGFAVHYSNSECRSIGPRHHAMKHFSISGDSGERIVGMATGVAHMPQSVVFKTNWGRQCIFGPFKSGAQGLSNPLVKDRHLFVGVYAGWMYQEKLTSCAILSGPIDKTEAFAPDINIWNCDGQGRLWDICSLPADWTASGPIFGNNQDHIEAEVGGNHRISLDPRTVSWLDLSKAVDTIEMWFTHPSPTSPALRDTGGYHPDAVFPGPQFMEVQFVSLIFRYSDGTVGAVGPQEFDKSYKHPDDNIPPSECHCLQNCSKEQEALLRSPPSKLHYRGESWHVGGKRVMESRIWSSVFVDGLQFVSTDGESSPIFGQGTAGEPNGSILFGDSAAVSNLKYVHEELKGLTPRLGWAESVQRWEQSASHFSRRCDTGTAGSIPSSSAVADAKISIDGSFSCDVTLGDPLSWPSHS